jgi:hypothetical protein
MRIKLTILMVLTALSLGGCAHGVMRGSVAMKTSDREAHICMGNDEVKVGDKVAAYRNNCPAKGRSGDGGICTKVRMGEGTVTKALNEHYSVVTFEPGVSFDEGTFVEKLTF